MDLEYNRSDSEEETENYNKLGNLDEETLKKIHLEYVKQNSVEAEPPSSPAIMQNQSVHQYASLYNLGDYKIPTLGVSSSVSPQKLSSKISQSSLRYQDKELKKGLSLNDQTRVSNQFLMASTPSNANRVFQVRPVSSGSGIGSMFKVDHDEMNITQQANANSPIKQEKGRLNKWINDTGMQNASDFHPQEDNISFKACTPIANAHIQEILEKGSDSEEEMAKPHSRFSRREDCAKTTMQWIENENINNKHVVNVNFDASFRGETPLIEEDEIISLKPLFLDTMKQVTTLENESEKDPIDDMMVEIPQVHLIRPMINKMDSSMTNQMEQHMLLSQTDWNNNGGLNQELQQPKIPGFADHVVSMNKTNMNFGLKNQSFFHGGSAQDDQDGGSSTSTNKKKVKRFESSRFTNDMFDPDHGPSERIEEEIQSNDQYLKVQEQFQGTLGDSSFCDREDVSQSDATNRYYQSYVRKFDKNYQASKGIGGIQQIQVQSFSKNNELSLKQMVSGATNFERDDMSMMSSVLGRQESELTENPYIKRKVTKKYSEICLDAGKIDEIEKELEELDSPTSQKDVLEEANEIVNDDDMISEYSAKISVINQPDNVKMIDKELQKEELYYVQTLKTSMKLIDNTKDIQVFHGPLEQPFDNLDINMQKQLGSGAQAEVFQVKVKQFRGKYVDKFRKVYNNQKLAEQGLLEMFGEFCIAKDLIHPSIVQYKYFMRKYDAPKKTWEYHILMELMEGEDMDVYLKEQGRPYVIDRVQDVGGQLISGLRYLHERKIIHQDLKPQNILFSNDYEKIKLVDFGVSTRFDKTRATRAAQAGTLRYMPPEQLNGSLSFKTDIWAFGCVLLQFCTGLKPYDNIANEIVATMQIFNGVNPLAYAIKNFPLDIDLIESNPEFKCLLEGCLHPDYNKRPTAEELFNNPFFAGYTDL